MAKITSLPTLRLSVVRGITFFLEHPVTNDDAVGEVYLPEELVIDELRAVVRDGITPSVTFTLRFASDRNAAGIEVVTGGSIITSQQGQSISLLDNDTIPAGSWVWLEIINATTGVDLPESFSVTIVGQ